MSVDFKVRGSKHTQIPPSHIENMYITQNYSDFDVLDFQNTVLQTRLLPLDFQTLLSTN